MLSKTRLRGRALRVLVVLQLLTAPALQLGPRALAFAAQARTTVSAEEAKRARAAAAEFSERLLRARGLAPVVREMFVADFARRYVAQQAKAGGGRGDFMFEGIPALQFERELAAHADSELWPRLYVAANDLLHYGFLTFMAKGGPKPDAVEQELRRVYPAEVFEMFARRPTLANFFVKRGDYVAVGTLEELRETTETLERAARLTREQLDRSLPLKPEKLDANMGELRSMADQLSVEPLHTGGEGFLGYPAGTRLLRVLTPVGLALILAPDGDRLKIVWASTPTR